MSFDNSRYTFDPWKDYLGVVMEQGRVQLDSDWNEWLAEFARRIQAGTLDTFGRAVYPVTTPFAFKITATAGALAIGAGRMYVDGLLAENHGAPGAARWDPGLDEMSGAPQISGAPEVILDYTRQPYLPGAALPTGKGPFLVYLDVWRRAVTYLEDPALIDKAVAVDTSGRVQTVWQVKVLDVGNVAGGVTCSTPDDSIPAWQALIEPSAGQLTTGVVNSTPSGPCCLASNTGYTGLENQFYRVEIQQGGIPGGKPGATFVWSCNNASIATAVTAIASVTNTAGNSASQLAVESMGRDQVLGFAPGNWIEITDDYQELNGQPGELHQIDSIDFAQKTITLDSAVATLSFPLTGGQTDPTRHTRIRRWDSPGAIPVPAAGTPVILENGISVTFDLNPAGGSFHTGDFWTFAARTADGSVEVLNQAYPRGIHHHYARLSIVTFPSTASDCRVAWPSSGGNGSDCCCTVTVKHGEFTGNVTLQTIIDRYQGLKTPTEICLMPGTYSLAAPLRFKAAHSNIGLKGCQEGGVVIQAQPSLVSQFADGLVVLDGVSNVSLRGISFVLPRVAFSAAGNQFAGIPIKSLDPDVQSMLTNLVVSIGVRPVNCSGLTIENCEFGFADLGKPIAGSPSQAFGAGVFAIGQSAGWRIGGNTFAGGGDFLAGILATPAVTFATSAFSPIEGIVEGQVSKEAPASASVISTVGGIQSVLSAAAPSPNFAARGGSVLPSSIDEAVFEGNSFSGLTICALLSGSTATVQFTRNKVTDCIAGFWMLSPLQAGLIPFDPNNVTLTGLSVALGYPLPQGDATPAAQIVKVPAAPASARIYAGSATYTDSQANQWLPDIASKAVSISGGALSQPIPVPAISGATPSASDQTLYQSERWGNSFSYTFNSLPAGYYQITLRFAEIFYTAAGANTGVRIFDVSINGRQVLTNLDVAAHAGGADIADNWIFNNILPNGGQIVVQFTGTSLGADVNAKIGALEVDPQWNGVTGSPQLQNASSFSSSAESSHFYSQLAQVAQQGFVNLPASPLRLRMNDNEMQGLSSVGVLILGDDQVQNPKTSSAILTGNRVTTTLPLNLESERQILTGGIGALNFCCAAAIGSVTRCVVSSNIFVNEAVISGRTLRICFILNDGAGSPLAATVPPSEIMASANLFQGAVLIVPARYPAEANVPAPMNSWDFLNTVTP